MNAPAAPVRWAPQPITQWLRWAPHQWSLRIPRPDGFSFSPGHYAKLGLPVGEGGDIVWRPYSIVSAPHEAELEFLITLVPDGQLTAPLARLEPGQPVLFDPLALGFFIETQLAPGRTLWMLATGSGLGPYVSMLREGSVLQRYERLIVVHSVRSAAELAYGDELRACASRHTDQLRYLPVVTREAGASELNRRMPEMVQDGSLEFAAGAALDAREARVMVCGNPGFTADMRELLRERDFQPCRRGLVGSMLFENYWQ
ncbi:MAG: ferredoxin--NADP reductase [Rhodocyclaceae bacterium]